MSCQLIGCLVSLYGVLSAHVMFVSLGNVFCHLCVVLSTYVMSCWPMSRVVWFDIVTLYLISKISDQMVQVQGYSKTNLVIFGFREFSIDFGHILCI